jgi:hypothetical protein
VIGPPRPIRTNQEENDHDETSLSSGSDGGRVCPADNAGGLCALEQAALCDVKNRAGKFVTPSLQSVTAPAAGAVQNMPDDFRVAITDPPGDSVYPISSFTRLLVYEKQKNTSKGKKLVEFIEWMLHNGQKFPPALDYSPLPKEVVAKEEHALRRITMPDGKPLTTK